MKNNSSTMEWVGTRLSLIEERNFLVKKAVWQSRDDILSVMPAISLLLFLQFTLTSEFSCLHEKPFHSTLRQLQVTKTRWRYIASLLRLWSAGFRECAYTTRIIKNHLFLHLPGYIFFIKLIYLSYKYLRFM